MAVDPPFLIDDQGAVSSLEAKRRIGAIAASTEATIQAAPTVDCILAILARWQSARLAVVVDARDRAAVPSVAMPCAAVALRTSGSSAAPKFVVHRLESLEANAVASNARTAFGPGDRWLLSLSPHHIGGLAIVVRAIVGGGAVRLGYGPGAVIDDLKRDDAITHCSLVATQLRRALDDEACVARMARMKAVLLGGGPAPASWRHEAVRRGIPLRATYGMTECASQVTTSVATERDDADDAGTPLDGVEVRIADDGEILVRGPTLFAGYLEDGALRDARRADGFFATGDRGRFDERGHLHVLGRKDAMFISGGENIHPEEIENALREVRGVSAACVVAIEDATWQQRPVAFVAGEFERAELERVLAARLPRFKWPDRIHAMPEAQVMRGKAERAVLGKCARERSGRVLWEK